MDQLLNAFVYILGYIGFAAITLIPARSFIIMRENRRLLSGSLGFQILFLFLALVVAFANLSLILLVEDVARCLRGEHCGPKMMSGWMRLASIGFWYLSLELLLFLVLFVCPRVVKFFSGDSSTR